MNAETTNSSSTNAISLYLYRFENGTHKIQDPTKLHTKSKTGTVALLIEPGPTKKPSCPDILLRQATTTGKEA